MVSTRVKMLRLCKCAWQLLSKWIFIALLINLLIAFLEKQSSEVKHVVILPFEADFHRIRGKIKLLKNMYIIEQPFFYAIGKK